MQRSKLGTNELEDISNEANVLLWNYKVNYGNEIISNRSMDFGNLNYNARWCAPQGVLSDRKYSVYDSGNITMNQNNSKISVTVKDYEFDGVFPQYNSEYNASSSIAYADNIGCFSVGYFQLIVPDNDATTVDNRNYYLKVADSNFKTTSITDMSVTNQMVTNDDSSSLTHVRFTPEHLTTIYIYMMNQIQIMHLYILHLMKEILYEQKSKHLLLDHL